MVFAALTQEATLEIWTGDKAIMPIEANAEFSLWDGSIVGRNILLDPPRRLEQEWYFGEHPVKSIVTIKLHAHKNGTSAELLHINIPDDDYLDIVYGWNHYYFGALMDFYKEG